MSPLFGSNLAYVCPKKLESNDPLSSAGVQYGNDGNMEMALEGVFFLTFSKSGMDKVKRSRCSRPANRARRRGLNQANTILKSDIAFTRDFCYFLQE